MNDEQLRELLSRLDAAEGSEVACSVTKLLRLAVALNEWVAACKAACLPVRVRPRQLTVDRVGMLDGPSGRLDGAKARVNVLVGEGQPKIRAAALRELCSLVSPPTRTDSSGNIVDAEPLP
jgi:hypothetical protein